MADDNGILNEFYKDLPASQVMSESVKSRNRWSVPELLDAEFPEPKVGHPRPDTRGVDHHRRTSKSR